MSGLDDHRHAIDVVAQDCLAAAGPGIALALLEHDVVSTRVFGYADLAAHVPVRAESIFEVGSISKIVTGIAVTILVDREQVQLGDDVRRYLPEIPFYGEPITVDHLLHHTAGMRDYHHLRDLAGTPPSSPLSHDDALRLVVRQDALNHRPGELFSYSDSHYLTLAHLVHRVTGRTLADFTHDEILRPLGMLASGWRRSDKTVPWLVRGYERRGDVRHAEVLHRLDSYGCSRLITTVGDLGLLARALGADDLAGIGRSGFVDRLTVTRLLSSGGPNRYAHGIGVFDYFGHRVWSHSGSDPGCTSNFVYLPERRVGIIVLTNNSTGLARYFSRAMLDILLGTGVERPRLGSSGDSAHFAAVFSTDRIDEFHGDIYVSHRPQESVAP